MEKKKTLIDSHVHLDLIELYQPHRIQWLKEKGCTVVSWSYFEGVDSVSRLQRCLQSKAECLQKHSGAGLGCYYLAGVHPRCIPPDLRPEQTGSLLKPHLEDPLCRGIGEIGLETGDSREQEVFMAQLELAGDLLSLGKGVGVHTPRSNKAALTRATLKILDRFPDLLSCVVVDHCTAETIGAVLDAGFRAGVTLSPVKTSMEEMKRIISMCGDRIDRVMCNTDSGKAFYEDAVRTAGREDLPEALRRKLFYRTAARFFNIG